jgi:hypothetical protein
LRGPPRGFDGGLDSLLLIWSIIPLGFAHKR